MIKMAMMHLVFLLAAESSAAFSLVSPLRRSYLYQQNPMATATITKSARSVITARNLYQGYADNITSSNSVHLEEKEKEVVVEVNDVPSIDDTSTSDATVTNTHLGQNETETTFEPSDSFILNELSIMEMSSSAKQDLQKDIGVTISDASQVLEETDLTTLAAAAAASDAQSMQVAEQKEEEESTPLGTTVSTPSAVKKEEPQNAQMVSRRSTKNYTVSQKESSLLGGFCLGALLSLLMSFTTEYQYFVADIPYSSAVFMGILFSGAVYLAIEYDSPIADLLVNTLGGGTDVVVGKIGSLPALLQQSFTNLKEDADLEEKLATVKALEKEWLRSLSTTVAQGAKKIPLGTNDNNNNLLSISEKKTSTQASRVDKKQKIAAESGENTKSLHALFKGAQLGQDKSIAQNGKAAQSAPVEKDSPNGPAIIKPFPVDITSLLQSTMDTINSKAAAVTTPNQKSTTGSEISEADASEETETDDLIRKLRFFTAPGLNILPLPSPQKKTTSPKTQTQKKADELVNLDQLSTDFMKMFGSAVQEEQQIPPSEVQEAKQKFGFFKIPGLDGGSPPVSADEKTEEDVSKPLSREILSFFKSGDFTEPAVKVEKKKTKESKQGIALFSTLPGSKLMKARISSEKKYDTENTEKSQERNPLLTQISSIASIGRTRSGTISVEDGLNRKQKRAVKQRQASRKAKAKQAQSMREAREVYKIIAAANNKKERSSAVKTEVAVPKRSRTELIEKAPPGIPTLTNWRRQRDGTISGNIFGSKIFPKNEYITTSPIAGAAMPGTVVRTGSGSEYFLAPRKKSNRKLMP